ncbi:FMN-binding negative transcriptional regulator [Streptomyces sp. 8N114]|uniref:FMN-binding negative transcriptional regulator n=1 Tax=Streptomyces sp. 8N114 TaxID=3457419 RepID=UPI003FD6B9B0
MFVPEQYREPDGSWMVDLIRRNPLALLSANGPADGPPYATHLPALVDPEWEGEWGQDLSGGRLVGHMNRANPHWDALRSGATVVLVFTGPHAYVSPTLYGTTPAAPTWDFTSVHVQGVLRKIEPAEAGARTLEVCKATVRALEGEFGAGWDMTESVDYFRRIVPAVGAFGIEVLRADGMFKLSQEQRPDIRERVRRDFAERDSTRHRETAALMSRLASAGTCPVPQENGHMVRENGRVAKENDHAAEAAAADGMH